MWEETIILAPKSVRFAFLSATIPNAREFAEWIAKTHASPCHVVYTGACGRLWGGVTHLQDNLDSAHAPPHPHPHLTPERPSSCRLPPHATRALRVPSWRRRHLRGGGRPGHLQASADVAGRSVVPQHLCRSLNIVWESSTNSFVCCKPAAPLLHRHRRAAAPNSPPCTPTHLQGGQLPKGGGAAAGGRSEGESSQGGRRRQGGLSSIHSGGSLWGRLARHTTLHAGPPGATQQPRQPAGRKAGRQERSRESA